MFGWLASLCYLFAYSVRVVCDSCEKSLCEYKAKANFKNFGLIYDSACLFDRIVVTCIFLLLNFDLPFCLFLPIYLSVFLSACLSVCLSQSILCFLSAFIVFSKVFSLFLSSSVCAIKQKKRNI